MTDLGTKSSITIDASAERVWDALTTPALIKEWFFGVETDTDWKPGSTLVHRGTYQGEPYEDKGEIIRIEPPRLLVHTHWSDVSGVPDLPEHYQRITWSLSEHDGVTDLTIEEENLPSEQAKAVSEENWPVVLHNLKRLLEE
jgi:uncharacterized protein YndB with AHSA1/START domain